MKPEAYIVNLDNFNGPLDLLLRLIELNKLDICDVSIAKITEDYLNHVNNIELSHHDANRFLEIAVKLILIKSRALLPDQPLQDDENVLESLSEQLKELSIYQQLAKQFSLMQEKSYISRPKLKNDNNLVSYFNINCKSILSSYTQVIEANTNSQPQSIGSLKRKSNTRRREELVNKVIELNKFSVSNINKIAGNKRDSVLMFMIILEFIKSNKLKIVNERKPEIEVVR